MKCPRFFVPTLVLMAGLQQKEGTGQGIKVVIMVFFGCLVGAIASAESRLCDPSGGVASILTASADDRDIVVDLSWDGAPNEAILELINGEGQVVSTTTVVPFSGGVTTERMPEALNNIPSNGFSYRLSLTDLEGVSLAPPHFFHLLLQCLEGECHYRVKNAVQTDAIYMPPELSQALDEVRAMGVDDVYGSTLEFYPHLEGEIYTLAWQLDYLRQKTSLFQSETCPCWWAGSVNASAYEQGHYFGQDSLCPSGEAWEILSDRDGAQHYLGGQAYRTDGESLSSTGTTTVEIYLVCESITDWMEVTVSVGGQDEQISFPLATLCSRECDARTFHHLKYEARLLALAEGMHSVDPWVRMEHSTSYVVGQGSVYSFTGQVEALADTEMTIIDTLCEEESVSMFSQQSSLRASLETNVSLDMQVQSTLQCGGPYAMAEFENIYTLWGSGVSNCTDGEADLVYHHRRIDKGPGASLVRWRP